MTKIVSLDVTDIARDVTNDHVSHVSSFWASPGTKAHGYVRGATTPKLTGGEEDIRHADVIVLIDGSGAYDAFMADGVKGAELLSGAPVQSGFVTDFMQNDDADAGMTI